MQVFYAASRLRKAGSSGRIPVVPEVRWDFYLNRRNWPMMCFEFPHCKEGVRLKPKNSAAERRRWPRLPLAIPVFVRSWLDQSQEQGQDKESLEFATALNVSAGGMLVALRRSIPLAAEISLEIPSAPVAALALVPRAVRTLRAKVLRIQLGQTFNLIGLKFAQPLVNRAEATARKRKSLSSV
jgi:hypothetical protein